MFLSSLDYQQELRRYQHAVKAITLAEKNVNEGVMASSAKLALDDAKQLLHKGEFVLALKRARKSLAYSVGIFHWDYQEIDRRAR
jgi:hypothetical protein